MDARIPCSSLPSRYGLMDSFASDMMLKTCIRTDNPPNPKINAVVASFSINVAFATDDSCLMPPVISSIPFRIPVDSSPERWKKDSKLRNNCWGMKSNFASFKTVPSIPKNTI